MVLWSEIFSLFSLSTSSAKGIAFLIQVILNWSNMQQTVSNPTIRIVSLSLLISSSSNCKIEFLRILSCWFHCKSRLKHCPWLLRLGQKTIHERSDLCPRANPLYVCYTRVCTFLSTICTARTQKHRLALFIGSYKKIRELNNCNVSYTDSWPWLHTLRKCDLRPPIPKLGLMPSTFNCLICNLSLDKNSFSL